MASSSSSVPAGAAACVQQFALRAPKRDDNPRATKTRTCAFTGKKPSKSTPHKPAEEEDGAAPGANRNDRVPKNNGFIAWLSVGHGDRPGFQEAREYLMLGAPYRGDSRYEAKEAIKASDAAHWCPNPLKQKGVKDGLPSGWWAAHTEEELKTLIDLPLDTYGRRLWTALDVPEPSHSSLARLIAEYDGYLRIEQRKRDADAVQARAEATKRANTIASSGIIVLADSEEEIATLRDKWKLEWAVDMALASQHASHLGPKSSLSCAGRTLRGLRFGVITADNVRAGQWDGVAAGKRKHRATAADDVEQVADSAFEADDRSLFIDYTRLKFTGPSSGCFMFGKGAGMIPLPGDREWERINDDLAKRDLARVKPWSSANAAVSANLTWCTECLHEISPQFDSCSCIQPPRTWHWCTRCHFAGTGAQPCLCKAGCSSLQWEEHQNAAQRAARAALEAAKRQSHSF